jgi:hypothetical protein
MSIVFFITMPYSNSIGQYVVFALSLSNLQCGLVHVLTHDLYFCDFCRNF